MNREDKVSEPQSAIGSVPVQYLSLWEVNDGSEARLVVLQSPVHRQSAARLTASRLQPQQSTQKQRSPQPHNH